MKKGTETTVYDCSLITLPKLEVDRGAITFASNNREVPFEIKRLYYLYDIPSGSDRGAHAHKELQQLILAASGSFTITVNDGKQKRSFALNQPNIGLYLPPGLWRELTDFSGGSICLVLASHEYDEGDYIRNLEIFRVWKS
ncbi:FdtA/QdtA family cupin domain-containing protein [uncultured Algoriphagus sp.]|uniref:sugar 3,4-ketoisomerase n=1 Tax=uncultured Algoriphagus sp. TaxID=417365 RepID=UPI002593C0F5|nr:FdtA/QdtA family cupin domain-containing protein [uncultured Algoriphagus sp.]